MNKPFEIDNHTIEFGIGSSTLDPWTSKYCQEIKLPMMTTADIVNYMLVDGEKIYRLRSFYKKGNLIDDLLNNAIETWEELMYYYENIFNDFTGNLSDIKKDLDEVKRKNDEFKKLSPKEKKEYIANWRAKRDAEVKVS